MGIGRNAGDTFHPEIKRLLQRVPCFLHEDDEEAPQTCVHMERYFVFDSQLFQNRSQENFIYSHLTITSQDTGGEVCCHPKAIMHDGFQVLKKQAGFDTLKKAHLSNVFSLQKNSSEMWHFIFTYAGPQTHCKAKQDTIML